MSKPSLNKQANLPAPPVAPGGGGMGGMGWLTGIQLGTSAFDQ
jgi:hypothetical protein